MSSEDRRAQILATACRLFAEKGYRGVTTRELAAELGVTEPVLYEHFNTKSDLYRAIIESKARGGVEVLTGIRDRFHQNPDDLGFFQALAESILFWYSGDPDFIRLLLFSNLENHELKNLFHERTEDCFQIVCGYISRRQVDGTIRRDLNPAVAARGFFGMVAHYCLTAVIFQVSPIPKPPVEVIQEMVRIFVTGMSNQEQ